MIEQSNTHTLTEGVCESIVILGVYMPRDNYIQSYENTMGCLCDLSDYYEIKVN